MVLDSRIHIVNIGLRAARRNCRKISCRPDFQIHILGRLAHCKFSSIVSRYQPPFIPLVAHRRPAASVVVLHRVPFTKSSEGSNSSRSATQSVDLAYNREKAERSRGRPGFFHSERAGERGRRRGTQDCNLTFPGKCARCSSCERNQQRGFQDRSHCQIRFRLNLTDNHDGV
jgi:hypothetical protein